MKNSISWWVPGCKRGIWSQLYLHRALNCTRQSRSPFLFLFNSCFCFWSLSLLEREKIRESGLNGQKGGAGIGKKGNDKYAALQQRQNVMGFWPDGADNAVKKGATV